MRVPFICFFFILTDITGMQDLYSEKYLYYLLYSKSELIINNNINIII